MPDTKIKKSKAENYLVELADQCKKDWLKSLIEEVVDIQKVPEDTFLDAIYQNFLFENKLADKKADSLKAKPLTPKKDALGEAGFSLKNLIHEDGVKIRLQKIPLSHFIVTLLLYMVKMEVANLVLLES